MRRARTALLAALTAVTALCASPANAGNGNGHGHGLGNRTDNCTGTSPIVCHFDVAPGTYQVTVGLGGTAAGSTLIGAEARRTVLPETPTEAGRRVWRGFTVDVRTPEGEPTGPVGSEGLDLTFAGAAPQLASIRVTPAPRSTPQILLAGDSTVCDQGTAPYTGWGQQLPQYLKQGISVANHADSGESTVSFLAGAELFPRLRDRIDRGDLVLIQLAHNDKQTDAATYRANLTALVQGVRDKGGRPVLVTPVVRRWFNTDGTLNNDTALLVNGLGVNHPAEIRNLSTTLGVPLIDLTALTKARVEFLGVEASKALYLTNEKRDNTHTSVQGATEYAALVLGELRAQRLVPSRLIR
jgi:lysophospholipase L1-like esterase